jgi:trans-aconitate methyltransferase
MINVRAFLKKEILVKHLPWDDIYKEGIDYWQFPNELLNALMKNFPHNQHILDVGCGKGELVAQLLSMGHCVEGIDNSNTAISIASELTPNNSICKADANEVILKKYDIIFLKLVLSFIEDKGSLIDKIKKGCKVFILVVVVLNDDNFDYSSHYRRIGIAEKEINDILRSNFEVIRIYFSESCGHAAERRIYILK